jgi:hypothetical protein
MVHFPTMEQIERAEIRRRDAIIFLGFMIGVVDLIVAASSSVLDPDCRELQLAMCFCGEWRVLFFLLTFCQSRFGKWVECLSMSTLVTLPVSCVCFYFVRHQVASMSSFLQPWGHLNVFLSIFFVMYFGIEVCISLSRQLLDHPSFPGTNNTDPRSDSYTTLLTHEKSHGRGLGLVWSNWMVRR